MSGQNGMNVKTWVGLLGFLQALIPQHFRACPETSQVEGSGLQLVPSSSLSVTALVVVKQPGDVHAFTRGERHPCNHHNQHRPDKRTRNLLDLAILIAVTKDHQRP